MSTRGRRLAWGALWLVLCAPAIYQVVLVVGAIAGRIGHPYDLEWMEGGVLQHAQRISDGQGIYAPPSVDFIPYLYTPLYPGLIAAIGGVFGITYQLGRVISVLALIAIAVIAIASIARRARDPVASANEPTVATPVSRWSGPGWVGAVLAIGLFAAAYPYVDGWYDLVRADTLFLAMATGGLLAVQRWGRAEHRGDFRVATAAAILTLSFFCKQTGFIYVAWGGVVLFAIWAPLLRRPGGVKLAGRRIAIYIAVCALIGFGGRALLNATTDGWFWTYVYKIHQVHDFHMPRFWDSFGNVLWHFPAMTVIVGAGIVAVLATSIAHRRLPDGAGAFLLWAPTYIVSTIVGAIGYGTEFAHYNAYMPSFLHGALAAGAAVPAIAGCARAWLEDGIADRRAGAAIAIAAVVPAFVLGITLIRARWEPAKFVPTEADRRAGDALITHIRSIEGEVWVPSHPWYGHLAGKRMFTHRMGVTDVTARKPRPILDLDVALRNHYFTAIVADPNDAISIFYFYNSYRPDVALPRGERPRVFTGARTSPEAIWIPARKEQPPFGTSVVFDFESGRWNSWVPYGSAWGRGPVDRAQSGQALVGGYGGRYFATSIHGGDKATGTLTSPPFVLTGTRITLRVGGGTSDKLRVELRVDSRVVRTANSPAADERLRTVTWDIKDLFDPITPQTAQLVLIDDEPGPWGHLNVDEVWLWP